MELLITGKNVAVTENVKKLVQQKLGRLDHYLPTITNARVELSAQKAKSPAQRYTVQMTLNNKGFILRAEERSDNIQTAIDRVAEVMARQVKRFKERRYEKGRGASPIRQGAAPPETPVPIEEEGPALPRGIVRFKRFPVKPMLVTEALEQMNLLAHDFFLFVNPDSGKFSCLYRRKDGKYGLIEAAPA